MKRKIIIVKKKKKDVHILRNVFLSAVALVLLAILTTMLPIWKISNGFRGESTKAYVLKCVNGGLTIETEDILNIFIEKSITSSLKIDKIISENRKVSRTFYCGHLPLSGNSSTTHIYGNSYATVNLDGNSFESAILRHLENKEIFMNLELNPELKYKNYAVVFEFDGHPIKYVGKIKFQNSAPKEVLNSFKQIFEKPPGLTKINTINFYQLNEEHPPQDFNYRKNYSRCRGNEEKIFVVVLSSRKDEGKEIKIFREDLFCKTYEANIGSIPKNLLIISDFIPNKFEPCVLSGVVVAPSGPHTKKGVTFYPGKDIKFDLDLQMNQKK